jgi:choice-of-anchor C domain-containing protein
LLAAVAFAVPGRADLVTNGSFENLNGAYVDAGPGFDTLVATSTAIDGWTVTVNSVDWIGSYWQAAAGSYSLDMSGNSNGTIVSQALSTVSGQRYKLTFDMAGNPDGPPTDKILLVTAGTVIDEPFTFVTNLSDPPATHLEMGWVQESMIFQATASTTPLSFQSVVFYEDGSPSPYGPALDNVQVVAVPEPTGLVALFGLGGMGLLGLVWRHRRAA